MIFSYTVTGQTLKLPMFTIVVIAVIGVVALVLLLVIVMACAAVCVRRKSPPKEETTLYNILDSPPPAPPPPASTHHDITLPIPRNVRQLPTCMTRNIAYGVPIVERQVHDCEHPRIAI